MVTPSRPTHDPGDEHDVRRAWACLAAAPLVGVAAFVAGDAISTALGYEGVGAAPWWMALTVLVAVGALLAVPTLLAVHFARRAHALGDERARAPAVILVVGTVAFLGLNLVSWVATVLTE